MTDQEMAQEILDLALDADWPDDESKAEAESIVLSALKEEGFEL